ncbi:hypothetical protein BaRGS_00015280 [Batillaria attramentaria]|uniref:Uncharacterized protein n=1 Tax=Batillaria attramentaria TaxID=370345 RepID=A0ABD0L243_9CAEN
MTTADDISTAKHDMQFYSKDNHTFYNYNLYTAVKDYSAANDSSAAKAHTHILPTSPPPDIPCRSPDELHIPRDPRGPVRDRAGGRDSFRVVISRWAVDNFLFIRGVLGDVLEAYLM